jgi:hypothetical protein
MAHQDWEEQEDEASKLRPIKFQVRGLTAPDKFTYLL